ncbi:MAG: cytochrome c oxidase subunit II [Spirochaetia bacterium]|nr:cytochrome c oxidase subunit II [Spirochaetota bacterium]MCX8096154.1 cytochrome c oxidase subunit II [Spirochaetota bacterium]MDW8112520.1 cytochrome c oxidase subunit II [Spirochaetia bacterium]
MNQDLISSILDLISKMVFPFLGTTEIIAQPRAYWDNSYTIWLIFSIIFFVGILLVGIYIVIRYRYVKGKNEEGAHIEGNTALEVVWIAIPTILALFLATLSFANFMYQRTLPADALEVKITAFMWGWEIEYPNGKVVSTYFNTEKPFEKDDSEKFYLPVGKKIKVLLSSRDVIHSFYVQPAMITEDAVPGRITYMWFQINKEGEYYAFCREYCGSWHSYMIAVLKVVSEEEFNKWLEQK